MAQGEAPLPVRLLSGWPGLGRFWLIVCGVLGAGALTLQLLGAPEPRRPSVADATRNGAEKPPDGATKPPSAAEKPVPGRAAEPTRQAAIPATTRPPAAALGRPGRSEPGPIADPDPALLAPNPPPGDGLLPRIALDGRTPMHDYAAGFDPTTRRPRVGVIVGGIGMSGADNLAAVRDLPLGVTLAVSPYARDPERILAAARIAQHEYLLAIPMEPEGFPLNDPDERRALMTSLTQAENVNRLHWAMSRFGGYVGATNAFGPMRGDRFSAMGQQLDAVLADLTARGLLFVDARPGAAAQGGAWNRAVDIVIDDDPLDAGTVDQRLAALGKLAQDRGSALGLISVPRPVPLERLSVWAKSLTDRGLVLAPVSALVVPPGQSQAETER